MNDQIVQQLTKQVSNLTAELADWKRICANRDRTVNEQGNEWVRLKEQIDKLTSELEQLKKDELGTEVYVELDSLRKADRLDTYIRAVKDEIKTVSKGEQGTWGFVAMFFQILDQSRTTIDSAMRKKSK